MQKIILLLFLLSIISCNTVSVTEKSLNSGNYDAAIKQSIKKIKGNKTKKNAQQYIVLLEEAYAKAQNKDLQKISFLEKESNTANSEKIYQAYKRLHFRQEQIKPLLPLTVLERGSNAVFNFKDYSDEVIKAKSNLTDYLYNNANNLIKTAITKNDYREAYYDLQYLNKLNSNYKNTKQLIDQSYYRGTNFVLVKIINRTHQIIPRRLENDLLNFDTYGLNKEWTVYHANAAPNTKYDYGMEIALRRIRISPEQVSKRQIVREKEIKDGWKYVYNRGRNIKTDSLGNKIKVDKFSNIRCVVNEFTQTKYVSVEGLIKYKNFNNNQQLRSFPIGSEYVFENIYANYKGDPRALERELKILIKRRVIPFPSNEQMVYDTGEDLKLKIKAIIRQQNF